MIYLVAGILVLEIYRVYLTYKDSQRVQETNKQALKNQQERLEYEKKRDAEIEKIRSVEMVELIELAKNAGALNQIIENLKKEGYK